MWEEASTGAFGSGCLEGLLRPSWFLLPGAMTVRKGEGWEPDMVVEPASVGVTSCPDQCPSLPMLPTLTQPPSGPWASRRSTWNPQTSQWSKKPCSCSSRLENKRHNPALENVAAPSDSGQRSGLQIQEQSSQPEQSTRHPLCGHELLVRLPGIRAWPHLGCDGICYKYKSLFSTFRDF